MVRLGSFLHLLSFHFTLTFPGTVAVQELPHAPSIQSRSLQQIGGIPPSSIEPILGSVPDDDKTHVFHALSLVRRLVDRRGTMVEVPEEELENLLDQINTLHSQVNDLLSSKKAENPSEDRIDDKSINEKETGEALPSTTQGGFYSSQAQTQVITSSPSTPKPSDLDVTATQGESQAEQTAVEPSVKQPEDESAALTQGQSDEAANDQFTRSSDNKTSQDPPQTPSTGSSQELSRETASSVPGGQFKETHTRIVTKTSVTASTASPQETLLESEEEESKEQTDDATHDECPAENLVERAEATVVDGTMTIVSEPLADARNTNCTVRTRSAKTSEQDSSVTPALENSTALPTYESTTSVETVIPLTASSVSQHPDSSVTSASILSTDAVVSAEEEDPTTSEILRQFRTLVFTSVLMRESTITVTSLQTELYTVVQSGGTPSDHVSAVITGASATQEEVVQQTETGNNPIHYVTGEKVSNITMQATPTSVFADLPLSASDLVVTSNVNSTLSDDSELPVATVQESSETSVLPQSSASVATGGTTIISHLSSFKTLLKPTTSITEA